MEIQKVSGKVFKMKIFLIISNFWAYRAGEWKNAKKPFNLLLLGLVVLIASAVVLGLGSTV